MERGGCGEVRKERRDGMKGTRRQDSMCRLLKRGGERGKSAGSLSW